MLQRIIVDSMASKKMGGPKKPSIFSEFKPQGATAVHCQGHQAAVTITLEANRLVLPSPCMGIANAGLDAKY